MIKPYGHKHLVDRYLNENDKDLLGKLSEKDILSLTCSPDLIVECERIADGSLTPVDGFFTKEEIDSVVSRSRLLNDVYFPIPIVLQVPDSFNGLKGEDVVLTSPEGGKIGFISEAIAFKYDLDKLCKSIFGFVDKSHPGVKKIFSRGNTFLSGKVNMINTRNVLSKYCLSPTRSREEINSRAWKTCVGFQTRNVPHMAHEYLQRVALEVFDGLLIQPIIGWKKEGDYNPHVVVDTYSYLINHFYPTDKVLLSGLQFPMYYAGPKEAVLHAIMRQNYGCTHFIVGRDHAGVGKFYGKYDAHKLTEQAQGFLDISVLRLKGPYYCKKCSGIVTENTCKHDENDHVEISGTIIRDAILSGQYPPSNMIRKEIVDVINKFDEIFI
jgi:sulfate adenylyltransferase